MPEQKKYPLTIAGLILYNVIVYLGITLLVMRPNPAVRVTGLAVAHFLGVILASLIVPKILSSLAALPEIPFTFKGLAKLWPLLPLLLPALFLRLPGSVTCLGNVRLDETFHFAVGLMVPFVYTLFFRQVPFYRQGLWFGISVAAGLATWQLFMLYPGGEIDGEEISARLLLVFHIQFAAVCLFIAVMFAIFLRERGAFLRPGEVREEETPGTVRERRKNITSMILASCIFFLMNGILDARLFPTLPRNYNNHFNWFFVIVMVIIPLIGWYVDKGKEHGFRIAILICSIFFLLAPSLLEIGDLPVLYRTIHGLATVGQFSAFMLISIYLARLTPFGFWACLIYCSVYSLRGVSVIGSWIIRNDGDVHHGLIILMSTLAAILFYVLIRRVTFIGERFVPVASQDAPSPEPDTAAERAPGPETSAQAFENRSLSPREREVAALLVKGASTREIAHSLGISEHTVKAHVRNVLTKFNVPTRKVFMARFIDAGGL